MKLKAQRAVRILFHIMYYASIVLAGQILPASQAMGLGLVLTYFRELAAGTAFVRRDNTVSFTSFQLCSLKSSIF